MKMKKLVLSLLITIMMILIGTTVVNASSVEAYHNFTGVYIQNDTVKPGDKVYVEFYGDKKEIKTLKLYLLNSPDYFTVEVKDLNTNKPYFIMPENAREGVTYEMTLVEVECEHGKVSYATALGGINYTNCFNKKYVNILEENTLELTNLSLASHYTTIKEGDWLWLDVEIKGKGEVGFVTLVVENVDNPDMFRLISLKEENGLQYIDVFSGEGQAKLEDGIYMITDLYINPDKPDYIRYSLDETAENARTLEFKVKFEINNKIEDVTEDEEVNNPVDENNTKEENNNTVTDETVKEEENYNTVTDETVKEEENNNTVIDETVKEEENNNTVIDETVKNEEENKTENEVEENISNEIIEEDEIPDTKEGLDKLIYKLLLKLIELLTLRNSL